MDNEGRRHRIRKKIEAAIRLGSQEGKNFMRPLLSSCVAAGLVFWAMLPRSTAANINNKCAVTTAPNPPFVPPPPYSPYAGEGDFLYGTDSLWTIVHPGPWKLGHYGAKLPY